MGQLGYPGYGITEGMSCGQAFTIASGGGGNTDCPIRPLTNELWIVLTLQIDHDDVARTVDICGIDPVGGTTILYEQASVAAKLQLYTCLPSPVPFILTYNRYLKVTVMAMAASKNITLKGWFHKIKGVPLTG